MLGNLTSYVPRFGIQCQFLTLPLEELICNPRPFLGYFQPIFYRRCFMCLKTFLNLRFRRD